MDCLMDNKKATFYEYDKLDRNYLTTVKSIYIPSRQSLYYRYWYDEYGRTQYTYTSDNGVTSMRYDDAGSLRFVQNQAQAESRKLTFYEYDNLKRLMIVGEATIYGMYNNAKTNYTESDILDSVPEFNRLTDFIDPNYLHCNGNNMYYVNSTIFTQSDTTSDNTCLYSNMITIPLDSAKAQKYIALKDTTKNYYGNYQYSFDKYIYLTPNEYTQNLAEQSSGADNFENFVTYPQNVRIAYYYDELPLKQGNIWGRHAFS